MKLKIIVSCAMLAAMYVVLSMVAALDLGTMKLSFSSLPILVGAILFGPVEGMLIGGVGSLLEQILKYGITPTTALWLLPACVRGLWVGFFVQRADEMHSRLRLGAILLSSAIVVTLCNTLVWFLDSKINGYYSFATVFGAFFTRIGTGLLTMLLFSVVLPPLLKGIKRAFFPK